MRNKNCFALWRIAAQGKDAECAGDAVFIENAIDLSDGEIASIVSKESPQRACAKLVDIAKSRGGFDNITIAVIPLGGQLKQEPPVGYIRSDVLSAAEEAKRPRKPLLGGQLKRDLVIVLILSILASLLVVAIFALWQSGG